MQGLAALALSNKSRMDCSEAPIRVLPQPGCPYSRTPDLNLKVADLKIGAYLVGHSKVSKRRVFASVRPPIEDHVSEAVGLASLIPRKEEGVKSLIESLNVWVVRCLTLPVAVICVD
ncbi:hypothetical protein WICPIJ_009685 [Wickerhamomyces pijperi]|uniref:Uncharacterized protein n=1 Tax=Wickerhamomyces pijperi TaxID=599730 RepID=A0A9P8PKL5_WICPI|nr:hypothetical protein WICPIJ_009685 [Wickerhamomyces pijperi]